MFPGGRRVVGVAGGRDGSDGFRAAEGDARRPLRSGEGVSQRRAASGQASRSQLRLAGEDLPETSRLPARG